MIPEYFINNVLFLTSVDVFGRTIIHNDLYVGNSPETTLFIEHEKVGVLTETPNAELTINGKISSNSIIYDEFGDSTNWNSVYTTVGETSTVWNDTYTTLQNNSAIWDSVENLSDYLPLSGGTLTGKLVAAADTTSSKLNIGSALSTSSPTNVENGDIWINSQHRISHRSNNIIYQSALTNRSNSFSDTQIIDANSVSNPSLRITQRGMGLSLLVEDSNTPDSTPFIIDHLGSVGIGLSSLSGIDAKLTVIGNVSATGFYYGDGSQLTGIIHDDEEVSTLVRSNSANWESAYSTLYNLSASLEESDEILTTVKHYLSTNDVLIYSLDVTTDLNVGTTLYVGEENTISTLYVDETEKVGILTETPNVEFTVNGSISANDTIYTKEKQVVTTNITNTQGVSAITSILAVSAIPSFPDPNTLYIVI